MHAILGNDFRDQGLDDRTLAAILDEHERRVLPRQARLWNYYLNPQVPAGPEIPGRESSAGFSAGPSDWACVKPARFYQGQEAGLPARLTGVRDGEDRGPRREIVIENDIAWRINAMVDFMLGTSVGIFSTARDEAARRAIDRVLDAAWQAWGGVGVLQELALIGHVCGHAAMLLRVEYLETAPANPTIDEAAEAVRRGTGLELVDPSRGIAVLDPRDYRRVLAFIVRVPRRENSVDSDGRRVVTRTIEVFSAAARRVIEDGRVIDDSAPHAGLIGAVPAAHVRNVALPFHHEGQSEVEPLIPLQDELNTRLSDRAHRVAMQSFRMYLAKGLEGFERAPVGPGQIWSTDNPDATIESFGGDGPAPGEDAHIQEIREALDKSSGVPPIAAGVVRAKIGNLSSANALRVTLMGVTTKTARKRRAYGHAVEQTCRMLLAALDRAGWLKTEEADRGVRIEWPEPVPVDAIEKTLAAERKLRLGVPAERVMSELGYGPEDAGTV